MPVADDDGRGTPEGDLHHRGKVRTTLQQGMEGRGHQRHISLRRGKNGGGAATVSHASGGGTAAPGGPRAVPGCELPSGPAYGEKGVVELAINDEADDGNTVHSGIGLPVADNRQWGGRQGVKPPAPHPHLL
jgi:hypothetical protein